MKMDSFIGKATLAVDSAGRTNFPKEFRKSLSEENNGQVVVTIFDDKTLALYPALEWDRYMEYIQGIGRGPAANKFRMRVTALAKASTLDAQNRIVLTPDQMAYAGIRGEVTFVGEGNRVRLWAPERYDAEIASVSAEEETQFSNWY
jgi:MraZ protein